MKHYIIFKFVPEFSFTDEVFRDIEDIFRPLTVINGISNVCVKRNCIDRENRFHGMIEITMEKDSLIRYDESEEHKKWKEKYGPLLEKKAIFDCE